MNTFESAWVIARRDFVAQVFSRSFILFLVAPIILFAVSIFIGNVANRSERTASQPVVAVVTDSGTADALKAARARLVRGSSELTFPTFRIVQPAENVAAQARNLLADEGGGYSAVLSGTLDRPVLTGPRRLDESAGPRLALIVDEARHRAALAAAGAATGETPLARDVTEQAAGNEQMMRRVLAKGGQFLIFFVTFMLATLLLSTLVEEKSNKVIEVLAAAVPLDSIFLGKLLAMLGISLVGLALWGGMGGLAYAFVGMLQDWVSMPSVVPAVGWPVWILLMLLYYTTNFMLLGSLFLGIGGQATSIREIQTITMPVGLLQVLVLLLAMNAVGGEGASAWLAVVVPFSSPMAMVAHAAHYESLWPHLLALAWQILWVLLIIRLSAQLFRRAVLKSAPGGSFFNFRGWWGKAG
ncbi:MAG TPA: ABC transporter permease [Allosphingosinicella sp.]|nr:ABC transporter permease [Allosphingosinicella sp.]